MAIVVDPGIKMLPDDHQVFVLHPGDRKRFYKDFIETNSVFLDFPGIALNAPPNIEDEHTRNKLRMARAISIWHRQQRPADKAPARDPTRYKTASSSSTRSRYMHEAVELYVNARKGDLVVCPGEGYLSEVYIGEFTTDFEPNYSVESRRYPFETIPARRVKWIATNMIKGKFSRRLVSLMQNRMAIIQIRNEADRREIYEAAYGDYIWKNTSGNLIRTTVDDVDLNDLARSIDLVNYFSAQYIALKEGKLEDFLKLEFNAAISAFYNKHYFGSVNVEIHSPGAIGRVMRAAALASYVSSMLALSAAGVSAQDGASAKVENSASPTPTACDLELQQDIRETMEMYANYDRWESEVCPRRAEADANVGLETDVKVKEKPAKAGN